MRFEETPSRKGICKYCNRTKEFLMPNGYCPVCDEDPFLQESFSRIARVERLRKTMTRKRPQF